MTNLTLIREAFSRALDAPPGLRDAVLAEIPSEVRPEVIALLAAHDSAGSFLNSSADATLPQGERIGPYVLLEKIGEGGMGTVYRASRDDGEFQREVAIKLVGGRLFAPEAERRFIVERRILAGLDHPNIVHMIDGGIWQGRRYMVMELVAGVPLTGYATALPLRDRLRLFRNVCSAIHYAHQHLVIHRDLKPSNILVTAEGQIKILDFGIARLLDEDGAQDATATALNPMTLACASPEQVLGEPLTLSTDIYALGLLLYELLTGKNPQSSGTRMEIEQRIVQETPSPPSRQAPGIARDLDAIALKALSKTAAARYASAEEMSADIARFMDHRPVLAQHPSAWYHAERFVLRNKALTATALALILAILVGLSVSLWQARRAEQQRRIAQRRFEEARRLTYTVIHDIQPKLAQVNGTLELRALLIEKTLAYLENMSKDAADSPGLIRELIESYISLAQVTGSAGEASLGDSRQAGQILKKGEALAETLMRVDPASPNSFRLLAHFYRASAHHSVSFGQREAAVESARKAVAMSDALMAARPADPASSEEVAASAFELASVLRDPEERLTLLQRCLAIWGGLEAKAGNPVFRRQLALVYKNISSLCITTRNYQEALAAAVKARDLDQGLLAANPSAPGAQMDLAFDLGAIGAAYNRMHDYKEAAGNIRQSVELRAKVVATNPNDYRAQDRLAYALSDLADTERQLGDTARSRHDFTRALDVYTRLSKDRPLVSQSTYRFAEDCYAFGELEEKAGRSAEACKWFHKSSALLGEYRQREKMPAAMAKDVADRIDRANSCRP